MIGERGRGCVYRWEGRERMHGMCEGEFGEGSERVASFPASPPTCAKTGGERGGESTSEIFYHVSDVR